MVAPVSPRYHPNPRMQLQGTHPAVGMPTRCTSTGCSPVGCQQHPPAPSRGQERKGQGQRGDLGIPIVRSLCLCSPLLLPKPGTKPACARRGDGSHCRAGSHRGVWGQDRGSHRLHQQNAGTAWANTLDRPLPSCQLGFELLLRLKSPTSSCLHPSAGGFASS